MEIFIADLQFSKQILGADLFVDLFCKRHKTLV